MDSMEQQGYFSGSHPLYALIGDDNQLLYLSWPRPDEEMLDDALDTFLDIYVDNGLEDIQMGSGTELTIDISETFANEQGLPIENVTIVQNTNEELITASINNFELNITAASSVGNATISILAECNGEQISDSFQIQVYDSNVTVVFLEDFETGNSFNGQPQGWINIASPSYNYFPFWCMNANAPQEGYAPHSGDWYMFFDNSYSGHSSGMAEGWMYKQVALEAEVDYRVSLWSITDQASDQYDVQAWIGSAANSGAMEIEVISEISPGVQEHLETGGEFTVAESGNYYLGIYGKQYGNNSASGILAIDDIAIVEVTTPVLGTLEGRITDLDTNEGINDAEISIGSTFTAVSDLGGFYSIQLPVGNYQVNCIAEGYDPASVIEVEITDTEATTLDIQLQATVAADESCLPAISAVSAYPNPFNPNTTIQFNLVKNGLTEVNVFNLKGQKVARLLNEHLSAGKHNVTWNGTDDNTVPLASGLYFISIKTGNQEKILKTLMIK